MFSVDYSIFFLFSLLFLSFFSYNCARFVLVSLLHPFLHIIFFFVLWLHSMFFFKSYLLVLLFFSPTLLKKSIACISPFPLFSFPFSLPFSQPSSFSQHWNTGGSHPEELERPGAHPRLKTRPQPPLFHPFTSSEPQFTDCVAFPERSIPGGQIALQMNIVMRN